MAKARPRAKEGLLQPTSIRLEPDLHKRARRYAVEHDTTLQATVNEALADYLKRKGA
jgi:predicted transcriptional regulator